ncbi:MAG: guanylate kinase [Alphaproteobacteria bacterium]|nr:guanylate kinase [Alphaproteobacteria bacterium]
MIDFTAQKRKGIIFLIDAPSGTGKGTVIKELMKKDNSLKFSVSATTRTPREGEVDGVDYYFISDEQYDKYVKEDAFYEYVDSQYGKRYGTLRREVDKFLDNGQDVIFDIDWMGARQMKPKVAGNLVTVYMLPPSIAEVKKRLQNRGTDSDEVINSRMAMVMDKISHWNEFDYVIVNDSLPKTVSEIENIIACERMKRQRNETLINDFVAALTEEFEAK